MFHSIEINNIDNISFTDYNILHSSTAVCATYLVLTIFGSTGLSVVVTFLFNMTYLLYGKHAKLNYLIQSQEEPFIAIFATSFT